jgi:hypothetical protein
MLLALSLLSIKDIKPYFPKKKTHAQELDFFFGSKRLYVGIVVWLRIFLKHSNVHS